MQPLGMHFKPSQYNKKIKLSTRCHIFETLTTLDKLEHPLTSSERDWFEKHPQFKHIFHMPRDPNHKLMGMWLLLLRTAEIEKKKEAWFVVNGVPIHYGLREHALMSGLDCRCYPLDYTEAGSNEFRRKYFLRKTKVRLQDVREKLMVMQKGRTRDRLKMAVLYFLGSIIVGHTKDSGKDVAGIDDFVVRAVNDLDFCVSFPWGRLSFENMLEEISHTMRHFKGVMHNEKALWPVSGLCIPLEFLLFEAVPILANTYIDQIPEADASCPRMSFTHAIASVIPHIDEEIPLLDLIMEEAEEDDTHDVVVASWMWRLRRGLPVLLEEMYTADVATRSGQNNANEEIDANEQPREDTIELVDLLSTMKQDMKTQFDNISAKIDGLEKRIEPLEVYVKKQEKSKMMSNRVLRKKEGEGRKEKKV
ncbi:PREDICTED: uncharacterized protein At3g43530-like [Camelina sativa]|uniref:Uncharacterized protein At3g43530-like n=1 Tax=Camelina sativa TaxID=90675 RepID=A0ABM1QIN9_CAMSA|nr:PREDICTED: uncharacterized protein At3g43530-like [Camelina sativa]